MSKEASYSPKSKPSKVLGFTTIPVSVKLLERFIGKEAKSCIGYVAQDGGSDSTIEGKGAIRLESGP